jgi:type I restriction enzyme, S subunit
MTELPDGWRIAQLGEVADTTLGKMLDRGHARGLPTVPYLRNVNVQWGRIDTHDLLTMELADGDRERFSVQPGDLLVCEGGEIGRAAIWHGRAEYLAFQKALHRIRSRGNLNLAYLRYLLELYRDDGTLERFATGSTIAHLPQQKLRALPVPLPPMEEQRQIVDILEDHLSRLDAARSSIESAARKLTALRVASLGSLWNKALALSDTVPISSAGRIVTGGTPSTRDQDPFGGEIPFLTPSDVGHGDLISTYQRSLNETGAAGARLIGPSAVVVVCIGATIGKVGWINQIGASNQQINAVDVDESLILPEFLAAVMAAPQFQRQMIAESSSTTMPILNKSKFSRLRVPVPDAPSQRTILDDFNWCSAAGARAAQASAAAGQRIDRLRRALLLAAFSGRLTGPAADMETVEEMANV